MTPIAFFDFDGTITRYDTFISFGRFAAGDTRFIICLLLASPWLVLWKIGIISNSRAKEKLFGLIFKGMDGKKFSLLARTFATRIDDDLRADTMETLKRHQAQSHRIAIVSASIDAWIKPWAEMHGINHVIATKVETDSAGRLTGRFSTPNCHGIEKVRRINDVFGSLEGIETYAYGDSAGDDAMLDSVRHPERCAE